MESATSAWTRDTPWRQGHILPPEAVQALGLIHPETPEITCVVVISHDCDLANANLQAEPHVEVIVGREPQKGNGSFFWAKSPRTLHVEILKQGAPVTLELVATAKQPVQKQALANFTPDAGYVVPAKSLSVIRSWLAVRYNRAAFPDPFVTRLKASKADKAIAKLIEPIGNLLSAIYFDVDEGEEIDRSDGSPYALSIVLVYPAGDDPAFSANTIEKLEQQVEKIFEEKHFDKAKEKWLGVALKSCMSISEDDLTVSNAKLLTQWRLEYMTLEADDEQPTAYA